MKWLNKWTVMLTAGIVVAGTGILLYRWSEHEGEGGIKERK
jgi:hypothetical protein